MDLVIGGGLVGTAQGLDASAHDQTLHCPRGTPGGGIGAAVVASAMLERVLAPARPINLRLTLAPHLHGPGDPTMRFTPDGIWRATRTIDGPATIRITIAAAGKVRVSTWGPGAEAAIEGAADLVGLNDEPEALQPHNRLVRELSRRMPGLRIGRTNAVIEALIPAIVEQKVSGSDAQASREPSDASGDRGRALRLVQLDDRAAARPARARALAVRLLVFGLLVLALADPRVLVPDARLSVVFAVDISSSVPPEQQLAATAWVGKALQAAQAGPNPVLIRIETDSAHGASSTTKAIEEAADIYAFVVWNLGVGASFR